jgi:beta-aspartyl-peptidase (threonine type)
MTGFFNIMKKFAIAVHGGAGTILRTVLTPALEADYRMALQDAVLSAERILRKNGPALEAVEHAVRTLEDNPLFNAGKGSVFTHEGRHEMDASIMDGSSLKAGAVSGVQNIRNPVSLARTIMDHSEHVFLSGSGAVSFAKRMNLEFMPDEYFFVQMRYDQFLQAKASDSIILDHTLQSEKKFGTVGAVALDRQGHLAAATSTGGMTNKKHGRIGDTPVIGAGTYANNATCAVSCTGHGEYFIRSVVAYDISCLMEYKGLSLKEACETVVQDKLIQLGGQGGLIAIDHKGHIEMAFNSEGMYRASKKEEEPIHIGIFKD